MLPKRVKAYMCTLKAQTSLKQLQDLIEVTPTLVCLNDRGQLLGMDDDVKTTNLGLNDYETP